MIIISEYDLYLELGHLQEQKKFLEVTLMFFLVMGGIQFPEEVIISLLQCLRCIPEPDWHAYELKQAESRNDGCFVDVLGGDRNLVESSLWVDDRE